MYRKSVFYDAITRDWTMTLDGEYVGSRRTEALAWAALDDMVFSLLVHS